MNSSINAYLSTDAIDYVNLFLNNMFIYGRPIIPLIAVPHMQHFGPTELSDSPNLAYSYSDLTYPIKCLNCDGDTVNKLQTEMNVTWIALVNASPFFYQNGYSMTNISNCLVDFQAVGNRYAICPPNTSGDPLTGWQSPTMGGGSHELNIDLDWDGSNPANNPPDPSYLNLRPTPSFQHAAVIFPAAPENYAKLARVGALPYWRRKEYTNLTTLYKVEHPIVDKYHEAYRLGLNYIPFDSLMLEGDVITLCAWHNPFEVGSLTDTVSAIGRYALAYGLYKVYRPGINQTPVYFYLPSGKNLWWHAGEDMNFTYGTESSPGTCSNPNYSPMLEDYWSNFCEICADGTDNLGISNIEEILMTRDWNTINNYWSDNKIFIGFSVDYNLSPIGSINVSNTNILEFSASTTPPGGTIPTGTSLIASLTVDNQGEYGIQKYVSNNMTQAETLYVKVIANYVNGESINEVKTLVLADTNGSSPALVINHYINTSIQGNIKDYSSSVVNYLIDVWK